MPGVEIKDKIKELDVVVLTRDLPELGLVAGDMGTIVMLYGADEGRPAEGYELEVVAADGRTVALTTVAADAVRPRRANEILHARELAAGVA